MCLVALDTQKVKRAMPLALYVMQTLMQTRQALPFVNLVRRMPLQRWELLLVFVLLAMSATCLPTPPRTAARVCLAQSIPTESRNKTNVNRVGGICSPPLLLAPDLTVFVTLAITLKDCMDIPTLV